MNKETIFIVIFLIGLGTATIFMFKSHFDIHYKFYNCEYNPVLMMGDYNDYQFSLYLECVANIIKKNNSELFDTIEKQEDKIDQIRYDLQDRLEKLKKIRELQEFGGQ